MVTTARTSSAQSARTTPMRVRVIPIVGSTAKPSDGRQNSPTWATPPWRTGIGWHGHACELHRRAPRLGEDAQNQGQGGWPRVPAGEDKAYDIADQVADLRAINVTPQVTQNNGITKTGNRRRSAIDQRTTRHQRYGMSQSRRAAPMIECIFCWGKQHGTMRKTKHRGICRGCYRLRTQADRLQSDPHSQTGRGLGKSSC